MVKAVGNYWENTKLHFYKHRYIYLILISVFLVYILPLLFVQVPLGHDIEFHLTRIDGLANELKLGHFPVRIYSTTYANYGYAAPLFYGDWLLYFPATLVVCGVNLVNAYKTFIMICAILTALSIYFSAQVILDNKKAAAFTAVIYSISTYFATDAIIRHANGEMQSFIFIPIAFAGLYNIILSDGKKWILLPFGLCGILVTHMLTAVMTVVFMGLFALLFAVPMIRQPKKFLYILLSAGLFLLLSASFILPMLEQLNSTKFLATDGTSANTFGSLETRSMQTILSLISVFNVKITIDGTKYFIPQGIGLALPVMIGWRIAYLRKTSSVETIVFLAFALLALFMTSRFFPWESLQNELGILQFPWRLFVFVTFFVALFGGAMVKKLEGTNTLLIFMSVVVVISFDSVTNTLYTSYKNVYEKAIKGEKINYLYEDSIGLGEYLPTGTKRNTVVNKNTVNYFRNRGDTITSNAEVSSVDIKRKDGVLKVRFQIATESAVDESSVYIDLPLIMYKGYKVVLETPEGTSELDMAYGKNNVIRVYIDDATEGTITSWYEGTVIQKGSFWITLVTFVGVIAYYTIKKLKNKQGKYSA
ncbi:MAG TPA: hypothetical protein GXX75_26490 [Clostridiales bacterium]|nr:hypothetical protein [Clostridiales bacterium]